MEYKEITESRLSDANAAFRKNDYSGALAGYIELISKVDKTNILAKQAAFNLRVIPRLFKRNSNVLIRVAESGFAKSKSCIIVPRFDNSLSSLLSLRELAIMHPATKIILEAEGVSTFLFGLFHKLFWKSSVDYEVSGNGSGFENENLCSELKVLVVDSLESKSDPAINDILGHDIPSAALTKIQSTFERLTGLKDPISDIALYGKSLSTEKARLSKKEFKEIYKVLAEAEPSKKYSPDALLKAGKISADFRKEAFVNGKFRAWLAMTTVEDLENARAHLLVDDAVVQTVRIKNDRPDVQKALSKPAGEIILNVPKGFFDGQKHTIKIVLSNSKASKVVATEKFVKKSPWIKRAEIAKKNGKQVVLFASHNLRIQGAQTSLYQTVVGLARHRKFYPVVFSPVNGPLKKAYESKGIPVIIQSYPRVRGSSKRSWTRELSYFASCMKALSPKVVLANTLESYHTAIAALSIGAPTVLVARESEDPRSYFSGLPEYIRKYADYLVPCVDRSVFVARATKDLWKFADTGNQTVIYNGLDISELERKVGGVTRESARAMMGISGEEKVVLSVGTVCERKGQMDLVRAVPRLKRELGERLRVFIVGMSDNGYSRSVASAVSRLPDDMQRKIHLVPHTEDPNDPLVQLLYLVSDVFVMSSVHESYPRVVLEALYFSLPVVTTRCFGVVEQIRDGDSGTFYESGNYNDLAIKLFGVIGHRSRLNNFRTNAYKQFEELTSYEGMVSQYRDLILDLMEK